MFKTDFTVNAEEFFLAVSNPRTIKRSPAVRRSKIPKDTLITPIGISFVLVETPLKSQQIEISGKVAEQISLEAHLIEKVANALKSSERIHIWIERSEVFLREMLSFHCQYIPPNN